MHVIGRSIGNYKIVRVLGEGGMGTVYLAEHPMIGKRVAVKMLRPDLGADPGLVSRFFQEAKAVNEIRHPNIVDISDFGHTDDGIVYFVMELMEGQSLRDRLTAGGPMPIDQAVVCARQVVDALAAAHRVGIVHRDIKPDNIFLVNDTQVPIGFRCKLFDFGVAKLLGDRQNQVGHKTIDGAVVGTPFYMSPEQALCQDVTRAADIYAMGVVMFEMLTGDVPFRSEQLVILLNAILKQAPPPPSRSRPGLPGWLDRLVLRCLEKDPEARPRGMEEVGAALVAGQAELTAGDAAMGATVFASAGITPAPVAAPAPSASVASARGSGAVARTSVPRQATAVPEETALRPGTTSKTAVATNVPRQIPAHGGVARPSEPMGLVERTRAYLDTRRVQRVAIPLVLFSAGVIVASIFLSSASKRPVTEIAPEVAPAPSTAQPAHASVHLNSDPPGAEVVRLGDNRPLGTTPVVDIRPVDGRQLNYRFHLSGYTDVQMPFQATAAGVFEVTATLSPVEKRADGAGRSSASGSGRRGAHTRERKTSSSAAATTTAPAAAPSAPATQPRDSFPPSSLPALGERNPVHRLGR